METSGSPSNSLKKLARLLKTSVDDTSGDLDRTITRGAIQKNLQHIGWAFNQNNAFRSCRQESIWQHSFLNAQILIQQASRLKLRPRLELLPKMLVQSE